MTNHPTNVSGSNWQIISKYLDADRSRKYDLKVLPKRWIAERTFAWIDTNRRNSKNYERLNNTNVALVHLSAIRIMLKQFLNSFLAMKHTYLFILILLVAHRIFAQPGTLDKTFGEEGKVLCTTSEGLPYPANSAIVKKDGALLAGSGEAASFLLKQFLNDGTPDLSFGTAGEARTLFKNYFYANINALSIIEDNKIVAAGIGDGEPGGAHSDDILLARYLANGTPDSSFGMNGKVAADFNLIEIINCMKVTSEGKILVAGYCAAGDDKKDNCFLAQFNSDGSVDTNFGDSGKVVTDIDPAYQSYINSIAITPDGSIIAAGNYEYIGDFQQNQILVAKYDRNGKLESDFGNKGLVFTSVGTDADYAYAVALQNDGKIVVAGEANYRGLDSTAMAIVRYNSNGGMDQSFNKTGSLSVFFW